MARRKEVLQELAAAIEERFGVEPRVIVLDLSCPKAAAELFERTLERQVGLYISNARAGDAVKPFLDLDLERSRRLLQRKAASVKEVFHRYGRAMKARGRGRIIIISSGAGLTGSPGVAVSSATESFEIAFAESLWGELEPHGIDVVVLVARATNTPALKRLLERRDLRVGEAARASAVFVGDSS